MIEAFTYKGSEAGPKFLVLGAIHGNEKCGTAGIRRVMNDIDSGKLNIKRGQVTFAPICNPRAYEADKRFIERNLNRYLVPMATPDTYEAQLGNVLCPMLAAADIVLDLHSYTIGGPPFASITPSNPKEVEFASILGAQAMVGGWEEAYAKTSPNAAKDPNESVGTGDYARRHGAIAVTLECGQHKDPVSPEVAYCAIRNALLYHGLTNEAPPPKPSPDVPVLNITHVIYRMDEGKFAKDWKNLEPVRKGETLAYHADGTPLLAPEEGIVILPHANSELGAEWLYIGGKKPLSAPRPS